MDFVKTSIGLSKTLRNASRLKEILTVFAKNGFSEIITRFKINALLNDFVFPNSNNERKVEFGDKKNFSWSDTFGRRLRQSFEELGPTFVKLGQMMSTREDLFPDEFIGEMKKLLNYAKPCSFEESKRVLEKNLGKKCEDIFETIEEKPIGMASIGIVYKCTLKTGEECVVKVRREHIRKKMKTDFSLLTYLAEYLETNFEDLKYLGLSRILKDFEKRIFQEIDFYYEMNNLKKMKSIFEQEDTESCFYIPRVHEAYCSNATLVTEFLKGDYFNSEDFRNKFANDQSIEQKIIHSFSLYFKILMKHGVFHADLHEGNLVLLDNNVVGMIDFGLVGHLDRSNRMNLISILYFLTTENYENLVHEFLNIAEYDEFPHLESLKRDLSECISPFLGLTLKQTNFSFLFNKIFSVLSGHKIYLPQEWFVLFRALILLDGVGRSLKIDVDIMELIKKDVQIEIKRIYSQKEVYDQGLWFLKDLISISKSLPKYIKWSLREVLKSNYTIKVKNYGYSLELKNMANAIYFLSYTLLASLFFVLGFLFIERHSSEISFNVYTGIFWGIGFLFISRGIFKHKLEK